MSDAVQRPVPIGWKERIDFPDFRLRQVPVKVDTGARTSALSAAYYVVRETEVGSVADITLALHRRRPKHQIRVTTPVLAIVTVKCTNGQCERRPLIETRIRLGPITKRVLFTLADRSHMLTPIILGRQALAGDFIVDANRKYIHKTQR